MTVAGRDALRRAAPHHLGGVERAFADRISPRQQEVVASALQQVLDGLDADGAPR